MTPTKFYQNKIFILIAILVVAVLIFGFYTFQNKWYLDGDLPSDAIIPEPIATSTNATSTAPAPVPPPIPTPKTSATVNGKVTLSPVCPVERIPPDPACAPRPYATSIQVFSAVANKLIKTTNSDANGNFTVTLPLGDYKIQAAGGTVYPRCNAIAISVKTVMTISTSISCDTGIR